MTEHYRSKKYYPLAFKKRQMVAENCKSVE